MQVAGRRDLLPANHLFVRHACEIDGGPLAAMHFFDRLVVVMKRTHAHALARWQALGIVADAQAAGAGRAGDDGPMALHDKRAVDGDAKPLAAALLLDLATRLRNRGLELVQPQARDRGGWDDW